MDAYVKLFSLIDEPADDCIIITGLCRSPQLSNILVFFNINILPFWFIITNPALIVSFSAVQEISPKTLKI